MEKIVKREDLLYQTDKCVYNFQLYKTAKQKI